MQGNPQAEWASQRNDYVKIVSNGRVLSRDGIEIKRTDAYPSPKNHPDAHIPLSEWIQWAEWNKK